VLSDVELGFMVRRAEMVRSDLEAMDVGRSALLETRVRLGRAVCDDVSALVAEVVRLRGEGEG
jgi:hypothetical protein